MPDSASNTYFEIKGFHLSAEEHKNIKKIIDQIMNFAPSDASVHLRLEKAKELFEGFINVNGSLKRFNAKQTAQSLHQLLSNLSTQIYDQLEGWKKHRFVN